jgi:branched-chain amino acid transport system substrate-binding protein
MQRRFNFLIIMAIVTALLIFSLPGVSSAKDIKVGAVINLTGPLSSWGQYHAKGLQDYIRYVNEEGGVAGNKIDLKVVDHAYKVPEAVKFIKRWI